MPNAATRKTYTHTTSVLTPPPNTSLPPTTDQSPIYTNLPYQQIPSYSPTSIATIPPNTSTCTATYPPSTATFPPSTATYPPSTATYPP
eukprot:6198868-Pleurochrysis_carterae.AAC.1